MTVRLRWLFVMVALFALPGIARAQEATLTGTLTDTTSGVLRTMELILGLLPMSQYDAAATPMYNAFQTTPELAPFTHVAARVPLSPRHPPPPFRAE